MNDSTVVHGSKPRLQKLAERLLFSSRWLLIPFYLGLGLSLIVLLLKFIQKISDILLNGMLADLSDVITKILSLVDLSLIANLLLMVMFTGYENFVSRFEIEGNVYRPSWMGHIDFGDIKAKLLTSIIAIASIHVLENFMNIDNTTDRELGWSLGILGVFVVAGLLLVLMQRMSPSDNH